MTFIPSTKRREAIAGDAFEARIERAIVRSETVYVLDGEIIMTSRDGCIETSEAE